MTDSNSTIKVTEDNLVRRVPDNVPTFYTNSVDIMMSIYDLTFIVGQIANVLDDRITIDQIARITMSPQHAKVLSRLLTERVALYESVWGPLPEPPLASIASAASRPPA